MHKILALALTCGLGFAPAVVEAKGGKGGGSSVHVTSSIRSTSVARVAGLHTTGLHTTRITGLHATGLRSAFTVRGLHGRSFCFDRCYVRGRSCYSCYLDYCNCYVYWWPGCTCYYYLTRPATFGHRRFRRWRHLACSGRRTLGGPAAVPSAAWLVRHRSVTGPVQAAATCPRCPPACNPIDKERRQKPGLCLRET